MKRPGWLADYFETPLCDIDRLRGTIECLIRAGSVLTDESGRRVIDSVGSLPSLGRGAVDLLAIFEKPDVKVEQVISIIDQDETTTSGVLKSARARQPGRLSPEDTTIDSAIRQEGLGAVLENVTWAEVLRTFQPEIREPHPSFEALQRHCPRAARVTRMLPVSARMETRYDKYDVPSQMRRPTRLLQDFAQRSISISNAG